jgi:hypothetical protein
MSIVVIRVYTKSLEANLATLGHASNGRNFMAVGRTAPLFLLLKELCV